MVELSEVVTVVVELSDVVNVLVDVAEVVNDVVVETVDEKVDDPVLVAVVVGQTPPVVKSSSVSPRFSHKAWHILS